TEPEVYRHELEVTRAVGLDPVVLRLYEELTVSCLDVVSEAHVQAELRRRIARLNDRSGPESAWNAPPPVPGIAERRVVDELRVRQLCIEVVRSDAPCHIEAVLIRAGSPDAVDRQLPGVEVAAVDL